MQYFAKISLVAIFAFFLVNVTYADEIDNIDSIRINVDAPSIYAVMVQTKNKKKEITSYSILDDGDVVFDEELILKKSTRANNLSIKYFAREQFNIESSHFDYLILFTEQLEKRVSFLWKNFENAQLEINIFLVPDNVKIRKESREPVIDGKLKIGFYFRENTVSNPSSLKFVGFVPTISHETYHLFAEFYKDQRPKETTKLYLWNRKERYLRRQKHRILDETAASLFDTCMALDTLNNATILNDVFTNLNGRQGTIDDETLAKIPKTEYQIPWKEQSQIGDAIFHTIWASITDGSWSISAEEKAAATLLEICDNPDFGNPESIEKIIQYYAADGIDAKEIINQERIDFVAKSETP